MCIEQTMLTLLSVSYFTAGKGWQEVDTMTNAGTPMSVDEAIADLLQHAWEGDESESVDWMLSDPRGRIVATGHVIHRSECSGIIQVYRANNPVNQLTTYAVAYVMGDDGMYDHTEIEDCTDYGAERKRPKMRRDGRA